MSLPRLASSILIVSLVTAAAQEAQAIHVVDGSGAGAHSDIQSAVDAAGDGDLVLVKAGSYAGFTIDGKGLVVAAESGATVTLDGTISVQNTAPASEVVVHGVDVVPGTVLLATLLSVAQCDGHVLIQDVELRSSPTAVIFTTALVTESQAVSIVDSVVDASLLTTTFGGEAALAATNSNVFLHGVELRGPTGRMGPLLHAPGEPGGTGFGLSGGTALITDSLVVGGTGGAGHTFTTNSDGGDGGAGLVVGEGLVVAYGTTFQGGTGGFALPPGVPGDMGFDTFVSGGALETPTTAVRRFHADPVIRDGEQSALSFFGEPFDFVWHILALDTNPATIYLPDVFGAIHPGGSPFLFKFRGVLNAAGEKTLNVTLSPTGIDYLPFWEQALMFGAVDGFVATNPRFVAFLSSTVQ